MKLAIGQVVRGRYVVESILGAGGTAVVYLVRDNVTDERHAFKLLTITSSAIKERMIREGEVQRRIAHPNVIRVSEILDVDGQTGLLMEYVDGPSLEQALGRYRLTMGDAETLFQGILAGVSAAHAEGLVHRDLKPANILLARTRDGFVPKVTDFGLAKLTDADGAPVMGQTRSGIAMGTPSYMSPEQIRDARSVDRRADVWSLGCMLYELVTRGRAFPGDEALAIYNAIVEGDFVPVRKHVPDIPFRLEQAIHGCLRVEVDERIPSCDELLAVLLGVKEWALPESTLTELGKETPLLPPEAPRVPRRSVVEYHPGGGAPGGTGITAASAPTALAPMHPPPPERRSVSGLGQEIASDAETPAGVDYDGDEAATVITRAPPVDGTLAPHPSPVAVPPAGAERAGILVGGGLVAVSLVALFALTLAGLVLLGLWLFVPADPEPLALPSTLPRPAPTVEPPIEGRSLTPAPSPEAPAPPPPPDPAPAAPSPAPSAPSPAPAAPSPAAPSPSPAPPRPAPAPVAPAPAAPAPAAPAPAPQGPVADPTKAEVRIGTIPYGAKVQIGNLGGTGPYKLALTPSKHPVIVIAPGYDAFSAVIDVSMAGPNVWCFDVPGQKLATGPCP